MSNKRMLRVNELLKRELADQLERMDIDLPNALVSISEVSASPDLRRAKVHVSILGDDSKLKEKVLRFLRKHRVELQTKMTSHITLKYTPVLEFVEDSRFEAGDKVLALMEEMERSSNEIPEADDT